MTRATHTVALAGEDLAAWSSLATLLEWLPPALDAQLLRDSGMTHFEYGILYALASAPDPTLRMSVLAEYANSSLSRLSRAVARLETKQWVHREQDPLDGRFTLAILTDSGLETCDSASPGHVATVRRLILEPLTKTQLRQLHDISRRILGSIRKSEGWQPPRR